MPKVYIKFKNGDLQKLRETLLRDLSKETFAVLMGKHVSAADNDFIIITDVMLTPLTKYQYRSRTFLKLKKDFIHKALVEVTNRSDVDTIIDVHTHPFSESVVSFSNIDDRNELVYFRFLLNHFDNINYASIVFSQTEYSARLWKTDSHRGPTSKTAVIKTQTALEEINSSDFDQNLDTAEIESEEHLNRTILALGLDGMRRIANNQIVSLVGVGGIGSVVAEHLVHMGFENINLFDHDMLEVSNLNRFVGAYYQDALQQEKKVDCVKKHLLKINPKARIHAYVSRVGEFEVENKLAHSDWIIVSSDTYYSRYKTQEIAFKYAIPFITAGVNITVREDQVKDISGEVITVRMGDSICLNCLGRINYIKMANERHPSQKIKEQLVAKGYVKGKDVKEPAVKTLNSIIGSMAVDSLINQYTGIHGHRPVLVYENNGQVCIYEDKESLENRINDCYTCNF